ncbi:ABC transporter [Pyrococcus furiosus DSM 3638]|uniref:ABC transporter n=3 Tax=Pyrococcus furiosus TaxID=2261 RepID=A0A5C0XQ05_PYRFU|nr:MULTISPECIES: ABC transporter permease [Pyrococcus]AAL80706.1 daunorubicin resistance membrane protein [Pyrococcus furiosus DSM 3638]AFN03375.1 daunorubicin resistance membrane protein [Pyrococcus furiosus COM1]MDK2870328.1 type transport system permease protein [Pyrococcus sp.]QEK78288.1 ABC transporter [Pyrococcus furiosus DSM 3638]
MNVFSTMIYRELKRFVRSPSRIMGSILNPLIWLIFFGKGWSGVFNFPMATRIFGGVDYMTYLVPGVVVMTVFNMSFMQGLTIIWDKQFGFMKEILVAPASRVESILGRITGGAIVAMIQGFIMVALSFTIADLKVSGIIPALVLAFFVGIAIAGLGVALALRMSSMEGFQVIVMMLMLPMMFLSGAFYPVKTMPNWMQWLAKINPLTYAVDGVRYYLAGVTPTFGIINDWIVLIILALAFAGIAGLEFRKAYLS